MEYPMETPTVAYVGVGKRFLALLVDGIIISVISVVLGIIGVLIHFPALGGILAAICGLVDFFVLEAIQGATIGKKIIGLRVTRLDGSPIGWTESIVRNLLRIVDGLFAYLVGAIIIWNSPKKQRLGDIAAKTVVISTK